MVDQFDQLRKIRSFETDPENPVLDSKPIPLKRNNILILFLKQVILPVTLLLLSYFRNYIALGFIGLVICIISWGMSFFINDYNVGSSENLKIIDNLPAKITPVDFNVVTDSKVWADGVSYEEKAKEIGTRLIKANNVKANVKFSVSYDKDAKYIAYSLPRSRHIIVTNQLLSLIHSDDELAFIIGHELAHIEYNRDSYSHKLLESSEERIKNFKQEFEADILGATFVQNAGYTPAGSILFFNTLLNLEDTDVINYDFGTSLATHPPTEERIKLLQYLIQEKYHQYIYKDFEADWSLFDNISALQNELTDKASWLETNQSIILRTKSNLEKQSFTSDKEYETVRVKYNNLVDKYNYELKDAQNIQKSLDILIEKFHGSNV